VDRMIEAGEADRVAHRLGLGQTGQIERGPALKTPEAVVRKLDFGQVDAGMPGVADLEQERLVRQQRRTGRGGAHGADARGAALHVHAHASSSFSAATRAAISSAVVSSVAARMMRSSTSGSPGRRRLAGTRARMLRPAMRSTSDSARCGTRMVISLKKVRLSTVTPAMPASASARRMALAWLSRARRTKPA